MSTGERSYWYNIYGLMVRSEFELPEASAPLDEPLDYNPDDVVQIVRGAVPASLPGAHKLADWVSAGKMGCLYDIEGVCRLHVTDGRSVVVEAGVEVPERDVRLFLIGSALGTIVHQRGLIPLHISMVRTPFGNIAFTGPSGAGKSTIAAALQKYCGWPILCDDVSVFDPRQEPSTLHAGVRSNKLWQDAIEGLALTERRMTRDLSRHDKFHLVLEDAPEVSTPLFRFLFELRWGEAVKIEELSASNRFRLLMNAVYRPYIRAALGTVPEVQHAALSLAPKIRAFSLDRPRMLSELESLASQVAEFCEDAAKAGSKFQ